MRRKEMQSLLEERSERITLLEQRMETMNQLIDGYRAREQSVIESLSQAAETAKRHVAAAEASAQETLSDAENRASMTIQSAEERASAAVTAAETQAARLIADAEENANALVCAAQEEYDRAKRQAEINTAEARRRADALNRAIDRRAKELSELASEFLGMVSGAYLDAAAAERTAAADAEADDAPFEGELLDAEGDPAKVMQNIYRLQRRDLPGAAGMAEEAPAAQEGAGIPEPDAQPEEETVEDLAARPEEEEMPPEFDDGGEPVREWQPEVEPEAEIPDVPRVSDITAGAPEADDDDLSLDALLDEIIRAGE